MPEVLDYWAPIKFSVSIPSESVCIRYVGICRRFSADIGAMLYACELRTLSLPVRRP